MGTCQVIQVVGILIEVHRMETRKSCFNVSGRPLLVGFLLLSAGANAQPSEPAVIEGRWFLTVDLPTGKFTLPVEITQWEKTQISAVALRGGVKFSAAAFKDQELKLKGMSSAYGPVVITARIEGAVMQGDWRAGLTGGRLTGERQRVDSSAAMRLKVFEEVAQSVEQEYYDPRFGGVDWHAVQQTYRAQAQNLDRDAALFALVNEMLSKLKTSHLQFALGIPDESKDHPTSADVAKSIEWRALSLRAGYLRIASFQEGPAFLGLIDRAFDDLGKLPALLIDVRSNGGGNLDGAMRLGDHLLDRAQSAGFFATRLGLERGHVRTMDELDPAKLPQYTAYDVNGFYSMLRGSGAVALVTGARAQPVYRGKLMILINRGTASAAEAFVAVIKEQGRAVLIGPRPTAGKMLSAKDVKLSGGWVLTLPEADYRTPKGVRLEGNGVAPDIVVKPESGGRDIPLIQASRLIEHPL
jgi:C-terminal processing protease CtpA/Prc